MEYIVPTLKMSTTKICTDNLQLDPLAIVYAQGMWMPMRPLVQNKFNMYIIM